MKFFVYLLLTISFVAHSQVVSKIKYSGNNRTKKSVLKKLISLKEGSVIDSVLIKSDVDLISRLPSCSKSKFVVDVNDQNNYEVTYIIEETNTLIPSVNFWTAKNQHFAYQLGIKEFNFLGENKQLGAFYRNNGFHSFFINYTDPFLFNAKTGMSVTAQSLSSLEPLYFNLGSANYHYTNSSIEISLLKRLTFSHNINFGINFFQEKYKYVDGLKNFNIPTSLKEVKFLFKTGFDYNRLSYSYQYTQGVRSLLNIQYVLPITEKQTEFYVFWNDFFYYKRIKDKGNLACRLRIGASTNSNSPFAPFALDNNLNIRGVGNIIDRGTGVVVLNAEFRYTLLDKDWFTIQTNTFIDAGNWRSGGGSIKELFKQEQVRLHPGLGLRFIHKKIYNAVLRLDYGRSIIKGKKEKGLVFGVGQYF